MDINERREALRARVREKLSGEDPETEDLVVQETEVIAATTEGEDLLLIEETNGLLALASSLIFIGSVLGIITGILLLQGNPAELLTILWIRRVSSMFMELFSWLNRANRWKTS